MKRCYVTLSCSAVAPVLLARSDPAKSTKLIWNKQEALLVTVKMFLTCYRTMQLINKLIQQWEQLHLLSGTSIVSNGIKRLILLLWLYFKNMNDGSSIQVALNNIKHLPNARGRWKLVTNRRNGDKFHPRSSKELGSISYDKNEITSKKTNWSTKEERLQPPWEFVLQAIVWK